MKQRSKGAELAGTIVTAFLFGCVGLVVLAIVVRIVLEILGVDL